MEAFTKSFAQKFETQYRAIDASKNMRKTLEEKFQKEHLMARTEGYLKHKIEQKQQEIKQSPEYLMKQHEKKVQRFISYKDNFRELSYQKSCFQVLKAYLKKKRLQNKELQLANFCKFKLQQLKSRRVFRALQFYAHQQRLWLQQVKQMREQQILRQRFCDFHTNVELNKALRRLQLAKQRKVFFYLKYLRHQTQSKVEQLRDKRNENLIAKLFTAFRRQAEYEFIITEREGLLRRKRIQTLKRKVFERVKVYSQGIKIAKGDRILKGYLQDQHAYVNEQGHFMIADDDSMSSSRSLEELENQPAFPNTSFSLADKIKRQLNEGEFGVKTKIKVNQKAQRQNFMTISSQQIQAYDYQPVGPKKSQITKISIQKVAIVD